MRTEQLSTIVRYYDACSTGDITALRETLDRDVVHYFLYPNRGSKPVRGADHLARYWRKVSSLIEARWVVDHAIEQGDEAVIEWTMFWQPEGSDHRIMTRGAEWFLFASGSIIEIRSYYQQREETTQLENFPYLERGYSGLGSERTTIHPTADEFS